MEIKWKKEPYSMEELAKMETFDSHANFSIGYHVGLAQGNHHDDESLEKFLKLWMPFSTEITHRTIVKLLVSWMRNNTETIIYDQKLVAKNPNFRIPHVISLLKKYVSYEEFYPLFTHKPLLTPNPGNDKMILELYRDTKV